MADAAARQLQYEYKAVSIVQKTLIFSINQKSNLKIIALFIYVIKTFVLFFVFLEFKFGFTS